MSAHESLLPISIEVGTVPFSATTALPTGQADDWETHRRSLLQSLEPGSALEVALVERIIILMWRLRRVAQYEAGEIQNRQEMVDADLATERKYRRYVHSSPVEPSEVREAVIQHQDDLRLLARFPRMKGGRRLSGEDAAMILHAVAESADVDLRNLPLPYVGIDDVIEEIPGWTADRVRECIGTMALVNPDDPDELLQIATSRAERQLRLARYEAERMEADVRRLRRSRLLPPAEILEKVTRYEAHLSRELSDAFSELHGLRGRSSLPLGIKPAPGVPVSEHAGEWTW